MLVRMRNTLKMTRQQLHTKRISGIPIVNTAELTKSTWAKPIKSYNLVPDIYKDFFESFLADGRKFPYSILAPSFERFIHKTTEKLICDWDDEIYILEKMGNSYETLCYPLKGISYVELSTMLLDSSIKISGVTSQGAFTASIIKFNTVTDYLFTPILENIRLAAFESKSVTQDSELEQFDYLIRLNYKFMNYAKHSLIGGEKAIHAVLQPEIRKSVWTVLGKTFHRNVFPTHMSILTDHELIMIREHEGQRREGKYGGIWDYIPLDKITAISLYEKDDNLLVFSIQLPGGERLEYLFQDSLRQDANQLVGKFGELTTKNQ
jgi:hypothetical protein